MKKVCSKCGIEKELGEFHKKKTGKYGVNSRCKMCVRKQKKEYYNQNKDEIKQQKKEYREQNKDKIKEYRKEYYEQNKDKIKEYLKEYLQTEHGKMVFKINNHKRRAKKKEVAKLGTYTIEEWQEAMQFFNNKCAWSGKSLTNKNESVDHIYPNSKGGTLNINNIVPCDISVNKSKGDSDWEEWYPKQPFYSKEREKKIREWIELKTAISLFD